MGTQFLYVTGKAIHTEARFHYNSPRSRCHILNGIALPVTKDDGK